jgi:pentatricopeptide repeat protein
MAQKAVKQAARVTAALPAVRFQNHLKRLVREGRLDEAMQTMYKGTEPGAFNFLLDEILSQQRVSLAFTFWNDMKKRHFKPNSSCYVTLFDGLANNAFKNPEKQLNVDRLVDKVSSYYQTSLGTADDRAQSALPHAYIWFLLSAGRIDKAIETFKNMPDPSAYSYSLILHGIAKNSTPERIQAAREIWTDLVSERSELVDARVIGGIHRVLTGGDEYDVSEARQIAGDWFGLDDLEAKPKIAMDGRNLQGIIAMGLKTNDWQQTLTVMRAALTHHKEAVDDDICQLMLSILDKSGKSIDFKGALLCFKPKLRSFCE